MADFIDFPQRSEMLGRHLEAGVPMRRDHDAHPCDICDSQPQVEVADPKPYRCPDCSRMLGYFSECQWCKDRGREQT